MSERPDVAGGTTLEDLRVLDLSDSLAGAYCTKLFADRGADVIVIEPPRGGPLRANEAFGPVIGTSKRSMTMDINTPTGRRLFQMMVEQSNLIVETFPAGKLDSMGLGYAQLQGIKRRIILTSITPHGQDGTGEPVLPETELLAGLNAFAASAIAAHNADAFEVPQHIDIAATECLAVAAAASGGRLATLTPKAPLFKMSEVAREVLPAPELGEHNVELYGEELGLTPIEMGRLRAAGVI